MYQVPTDSLYKFSAITGIIIIICSFYFPLSFSITLNKQLIDMEYELTKLNLEMSYTKKDLNNLIEKLPSGNDKLNKLNLLIREQEVKKNKLESNNKKLETTFISSKTLNEVTRIGSLFGFFLSFWGFIMWYKKIQIHQDKLLLKSLEDK